MRNDADGRLEFTDSHPETGLSSNLNLEQLRSPICEFAQSIIVALLLNLRKIPVTQTRGDHRRRS